MGQPVVHFEIIGKAPEQLRTYYGDLFGWKFDTTPPVAEAISEPGNYGFINPDTSSGETGIPGGVGGERSTKVMRSSTLVFRTSRPRCRKQRVSGASASWAPRRHQGGTSWLATSPIPRAI